MENFEIEHPTKVIFEWGFLNQAGAELSSLGRRAIVITSGSSLKKNGVLDRLTKTLKKSGIKTLVINPVGGEPTLESITKATGQSTTYGPDLVIGLGGGSAIDSAKAISACLANKKDISKLILNSDLIKTALPIVAIPTTAGSGSEVSKGAIISDTQRQIKVGLRSSLIIPRLALLDPELTVSVSPRITALTGFDALAHAVESFMSLKSNLYTQMISKEVVSQVLKHLPIAVKEGRNKIARTRLAYASLLAGYNLAYVGTCLPHRIQYTFGTIPGVTHPEGIVALYPAWLKLLEVSSQIPVREILLLIKNLKLVTSLSQFGISSHNVDELVRKTSGDLKADPIYKGDRTVKNIISGSL